MLNTEIIVRDQSTTYDTLYLGQNLGPEQVKVNIMLAELAIKQKVEATGGKIDEPFETSIITWGTPELAE